MASRESKKSHPHKRQREVSNQHKEAERFDRCFHALTMLLDVKNRTKRRTFEQLKTILVALRTVFDNEPGQVGGYLENLASWTWEPEHDLEAIQTVFQGLGCHWNAMMNLKILILQLGEHHPVLCVDPLPDDRSVADAFKKVWPNEWHWADSKGSMYVWCNTDCLWKELSKTQVIYVTGS